MTLEPLLYRAECILEYRGDECAALADAFCVVGDHEERGGGHEGVRREFAGVHVLGQQRRDVCQHHLRRKTVRWYLRQSDDI